jgi:hypothetical protein
VGPVECCDHGVKPKAALLFTAPCRNREIASGPKSEKVCALNNDVHVRCAVIDRSQSSNCRQVIDPTFDRDRSLSDLRCKHLWVEPFGNVMTEPDAIKARAPNHDSVNARLRRLRHSLGHISPDLDKAKIGPNRKELGPSAHRAGGNCRSVWEIGERGTNEPVTGIVSVWHAGNHQSWGLRRWKVLR